MIEYEIISKRKIRHINVFVNEITYRSHHLHNETEFILTLSGEGTITISGNPVSVKTGDIIVIPGSQPHEIKADKDKLVLEIIQISNHFLNDYFPKMRNLSFLEYHLDPSDPIYPEIRSLFLELGIAYFGNEENYELLSVSLLSKLIWLLLNSLKHEMINEKEYQRRKKNTKRIERISSYIEANYQDQIRLKDIAQMEDITITYLSHIIRDAYGISFQEYLNNFRFEHSLRLISNQEMNLSDISFESGFSELKYMNAMYLKTFHMSAKKFRENMPSIIPSKKKDVFTLENILDPTHSIALLKERL